MDPVQAARDFATKIYDVHLKDTEILWHVVRKAGIQPVNHARWWRFRVPGEGSVDWKGFFAVLSEAFFTLPQAVRSIYPELYGQLALFYKQDPAARIKS